MRRRVLPSGCWMIDTLTSWVSSQFLTDSDCISLRSRSLPSWETIFSSPKLLEKRRAWFRENEAQKPGKNTCHFIDFCLHDGYHFCLIPQQQRKPKDRPGAMLPGPWRLRLFLPLHLDQVEKTEMYRPAPSLLPQGQREIRHHLG